MTKLKTATLLLVLPLLIVSYAKAQSQISGDNFNACVGEGIGPDGKVTSFFEFNMGKRVFRVPFADRKAAQAYFDGFKKAYLDEEKTGKGMGGRILFSQLENLEWFATNKQEYILVDFDKYPNYGILDETVLADYLIDKFGQIVDDFLQVGLELMSYDLTEAQEKRVLEIANKLDALDSF